jgi:hypothetical protein
MAPQKEFGGNAKKVMSGRRQSTIEVVETVNARVVLNKKLRLLIVLLLHNPE